MQDLVKQLIVTVWRMLIIFGLLITATFAQAISNNHAMNAPDQFAWELFITLNQPAVETKRGIADQGKSIASPGLRVWETWKITTPTGGEVFLTAGKKPQSWEIISDRQHFTNLILSPRKFTFSTLMLQGRNPHAVFSRTNPGLDVGEESRINKPGFEYIVDNGLYSIDGQEAFRKTGKNVDFPEDTVAIKASWRRFTGAEIETGIPSRFYTAIDESGNTYGLSGFHISTKAIPNWFWATFEQVDNLPPEIPDRDRYTSLRYPNSTSSIEGRLRNVPEPLRGTVFQYYVLRGSQTGFTDTTGTPIILSNTQLEAGMQTTASCMTCHSRATIGERLDNVSADGRALFAPGTFIFPDSQINTCGDNRLTVDPVKTFWQQDPQLPNPQNAISLQASANGTPDPNWFTATGTGRSRYTQLDFLWEFIFAQREGVDCAK